MRTPGSQLREHHLRVVGAMARIADPHIRATVEMGVAWSAKVCSTAERAIPTIAKAVFLAHNDEVRAAVPAERLLVFEVREGWQPLCAFLEVPVPDSPFPSLNDAEQFRALVGGAT
jgi:Sulfotransferase domain